MDLHFVSKDLKMKVEDSYPLTFTCNTHRGTSVPIYRHMHTTSRWDLKKEEKLGMVMYTFNPSTFVSERQVDLFEFKANLVNIANTWVARAT